MMEELTITLEQYGQIMGLDRPTEYTDLGGKIKMSSEIVKILGGDRVLTLVESVNFSDIVVNHIFKLMTTASDAVDLKKNRQIRFATISGEIASIDLDKLTLLQGLEVMSATDEGNNICNTFSAAFPEIDHSNVLISDAFEVFFCAVRLRSHLMDFMAQSSKVNN